MVNKFIEKEYIKWQILNQQLVYFMNLLIILNQLDLLEYYINNMIQFILAILKILYRIFKKRKIKC